MRLSTQFFWKGIRQEVQSYVKHCMVCQQAKDSKGYQILRVILGFMWWSIAYLNMVILCH